MKGKDIQADTGGLIMDYPLLKVGTVVPPLDLRIDKFLGIWDGKYFYKVTSASVVNHQGRLTNEFIAQQMGPLGLHLVVRDAFDG